MVIKLDLQKISILAGNLGYARTAGINDLTYAEVNELVAMRDPETRGHATQTQIADKTWRFLNRNENETKKPPKTTQTDQAKQETDGRHFGFSTEKLKGTMTKAIQTIQTQKDTCNATLTTNFGSLTECLDKKMEYEKCGVNNTTEKDCKSDNNGSLKECLCVTDTTTGECLVYGDYMYNKGCKKCVSKDGSITVDNKTVTVNNLTECYNNRTTGCIQAIAAVHVNRHACNPAYTTVTVVHTTTELEEFRKKFGFKGYGGCKQLPCKLTGRPQRPKGDPESFTCKKPPCKTAGKYRQLKASEGSGGRILN